jgi:hypothetical protein
VTLTPRGLIKTTPELEAKTIFEALLERRPEVYQAGQLRTLQRRLKRWRAADRRQLELPVGDN